MTAIPARAGGRADSCPLAGDAWDSGAERAIDGAVPDRREGDRERPDSPRLGP